MATTTLGAAIKTTYDGKGVADATKGLKSAGQAAKDAGDDSQRGVAGVKNLYAAITAFAATGVVAAAGRAMIEFGRAVNEGADLLVAERQFERLAESIGTTADALRDDMRDASGGMVTNANLVSSAVELMSGKLAMSHDAVVRMSAVSGQLNWDMGVLAQTINNQSTMRLDNLGLAVDDVIPRFNELREAMGDRDAFAMAVIEAGEQRLELVGSTADTTAGAIDRMTVAWEDMQAGLKTGAAEGLAPTIAALDEMLISLGGLGEVSRDVGAAFVQGILGPLKDMPAVLNAIGAFISTGDIRHLEMFAEAQIEVAEAIEYTIPNWIGSQNHIRAYLEHMAKATASMRNMSEVTERWNQTNIENSAQLADLFAGFVDTSTAVDETGLALFNAAAAAGASAEALALLGVATGVFSDAQAEAALRAAATQQKILELGEAIASGMSIPDALEELRLFEDALAGVSGEGETSSGIVEDLAKKIDALDGRSARMTVYIDTVGKVPAEGLGLGQGSSPPGRAHGGPVAAGQAYYVHQDEIFIPNESGRMYNPGQQGGLGGGGETHYHLHVNGSQAPLAQEFALLEAQAA